MTGGGVERPNSHNSRSKLTWKSGSRGGPLEIGWKVSCYLKFFMLLLLIDSQLQLIGRTSVERCGGELPEKFQDDNERDSHKQSHGAMAYGSHSSAYGAFRFLCRPRRSGGPLAVYQLSSYSLRSNRSYHHAIGT